MKQVRLFLKQIVRFAISVLSAMRLEVRRMRKEYAAYSVFKERARVLADGGRFRCSWGERWLFFDDATEATSFDSQYVYHTAWAARILAETHPALHVDIGSCLRFATLTSAFIPIAFYDYRPAAVTLSGLTSGHANLVALPFADTSIDSLSCMYVVEHIGLGRYGDIFDPQGDLKAMKELARVVSPGGQLLFVVPVGKEARVQYNAHRIYTYAQIYEYFVNKFFTLSSFAYIADSGKFISNAEERDTLEQNYGCGCFYFIRRPE